MYRKRAKRLVEKEENLTSEVSDVPASIKNLVCTSSFTSKFLIV